MDILPDRRRFVRLICAAAIVGPTGNGARAQAGRVYRIGILETVSADRNRDNMDALLRGLRARGYVEGQNLRIRNLVAKGWAEADLVSADSLQTAEEIYFLNVQTDAGDSRPAPSPQWDPAAHAPRHGNATSLGLFGFDGGR